MQRPFLAQNPGALDARQGFAQSAKEIDARAKGHDQVFDGDHEQPVCVQVEFADEDRPQSRARKRPKKLLYNQPIQDITALRMAGQAAEAMGLWGTAALAYDNIREVKEEDTGNLLVPRLRPHSIWPAQGGHQVGRAHP